MPSYTGDSTAGPGKFDCNIDFDPVFIFSNDCLVLLSISRYRKNSNVFFLLEIVGPFETEFPIARLGSTDCSKVSTKKGWLQIYKRLWALSPWSENVHICWEIQMKPSFPKAQCSAAKGWVIVCWFLSQKSLLDLELLVIATDKENFLQTSKKTRKRREFTHIHTVLLPLDIIKAEELGSAS